jgi:hypothetical protein
MTYLRCTIGRWNIDLSSDEGQETFRLINDEGLRVFRSQPGFIRYRLQPRDARYGDVDRGGDVLERGQLRVLYRAPERNTPALRFCARLWPENPLR